MREWEAGEKDRDRDRETRRRRESDSDAESLFCDNSFGGRTRTLATRASGSGSTGRRWA